jgi:hypothetical protein
MRLAIRTATAAATMLVALALFAAAAQAVWSTTGSGSGRGAATVMPTGTTPTAVASGSNVTVTWPAATFPDGSGVAGYVIHRYDAANGTPATVGAQCSATVTTTTCTEQAVPAGSWVYTDAPVQAAWTGGESSPSAAVTVP